MFMVSLYRFILCSIKQFSLHLNHELLNISFKHRNIICPSNKYTDPHIYSHPFIFIGRLVLRINLKSRVASARISELLRNIISLSAFINDQRVDI